jgi:hypothetical protein
VRLWQSPGTAAEFCFFGAPSSELASVIHRGFGAARSPLLLSPFVIAGDAFGKPIVADTLDTPDALAAGAGASTRLSRAVIALRVRLQHVCGVSRVG